MFVTMGTSLFHSATWEATPDLLEEIPAYRSWMKEDLLRSPDDRKSSPEGAQVRSRLQALLRLDNGKDWATRLPADLLAGRPDPATVMRFSAEMSTVLKLAEREPRGESTLGTFLRDYDRILLICEATLPEKGRASTYVAAAHLAAYLNRVSGDERASVSPISVISSSEPDELLAESRDMGLRALAERLASAAKKYRQLDLVISGGYKIYGIFLSPLLRSRQNRVLYIHEDGRRLMVVTGRGDEEDLFSYLEESVAQFDSR